MARPPTHKEAVAAAIALLPWRREVLGEMVKLLADGADTSEEDERILRKSAIRRLAASEKKNPADWARIQGLVAAEDVAELAIHPDSRSSARMMLVFDIPDWH